MSEAPNPACILDPPFDAGLLTAFHANGLGVDEEAQVLEHLGHCGACRLLLRGLVPWTPVEVEGWLGSLPLPRAEDEAPPVWGQATPAAPSPNAGGNGGLPVMQARGRGRGRLWALGAAAAVAAALALTWGLQAPPPEPPRGAPLAVAAYVAGPLLGGDAQVKSDGPETRTVFRPTSTVKWVLRPPTALAMPPAARAFVVRDGRLAPLPADALRPLAGGAFELQGRVEALLGSEAGPRTLVVGLAADAGTLEGAVGQSLVWAQARPGTRWYTTALRVEAAP